MTDATPLLCSIDRMRNEGKEEEEAETKRWMDGWMDGGRASYLEFQFVGVEERSEGSQVNVDHERTMMQRLYETHDSSRQPPPPLTPSRFPLLTPTSHLRILSYPRIFVLDLVLVWSSFSLSFSSCSMSSTTSSSRPPRISSPEVAQACKPLPISSVHRLAAVAGQHEQGQGKTARCRSSLKWWR